MPPAVEISGSDSDEEQKVEQKEPLKEQKMEMNSQQIDSSSKPEPEQPETPNDTSNQQSQQVMQYEKVPEKKPDNVVATLQEKSNNALALVAQ